MSPSAVRLRTLERLVRDWTALTYAAVVMAGCVLSAAIVRLPSLVGVVLPLTIGFMAVAVTLRCLGQHLDDEARHRVAWWTVVSLLLHLLAGVIITNTSLSLYLGGDAFTYHRGAIGILRHWNDGFPMPQNLSAGKEGFYYVLAGLYRIFGVSTTTGLVLNATLSALLVPLLVDSTRRLFGPDAARRIPPLAVLLPGMFIWSTQLLKEACVLFLVTVAVNGALRMTERMTPGALAMLTASLAALMTFRAQVGFVVAASMLIGLTLGGRGLLGGVSTGIGTMAVVGLLLGSGLGYAGLQVALDTDLKQADVVRLDSARSASSGFAENVRVSNTREAVSFLPRGLAALLLGPFPWELVGVRQLPAVFDVLAWWYLIPFLWLGFRAGWRLVHRQLLVLILPAGAASAVVALAVGNYGTIVRERTQIVVMLLPLIAYGLSLRRPSVEPTSPAEAVRPPALSTV